MNHDDSRTDVDPLEQPDVVANLSAEYRALLRRADDGDETARTQALPVAAALIDALAAVGLLEFAYLAPGEEEEEEGPIAWLEVAEALVDKERDAVVVAGSEILEVYDGPIVLEDPPENAEVEGRET